MREVGTFIVFEYDNKQFPGQIIAFDDKEVIINAMEKSLKAWKWPQKKDQMSYSWDDVLGSINPPKQISKRGFYDVPELKTWWQ